MSAPARHEQPDPAPGSSEGENQPAGPVPPVPPAEPVPGPPIQTDTPAALVDLASDLLLLLGENVQRMVSPRADTAAQLVEQAEARMRQSLDPQSWRTFGAALRYQLQEHRAFLERRQRGDYQTDPYGTDPEIIDLFRPLFTFLYRRWWRICTEGIEHVPAEGPALLVANHSGVLPWDGAMIATAVEEEHPQPRLVRNLFMHWFSQTPFLSPLFTSLGQLAGTPENATHLLEDNQLVCTFPEGARGVGKMFDQRYRVQRFGRGGFVQVALRTGAPLIPVAVVGAEETYPLLGDAQPLARLVGTPFFPLTPFFPWLGLLGIIPLPTRWYITFCPPIPTAAYGPDAADDPLTVFMLTEQVRSTVQQTINARLAARPSVFR